MHLFPPGWGRAPCNVLAILCQVDVALGMTNADEYLVSPISPWTVLCIKPCQWHGCMHVTRHGARHSVYVSQTVL